MILPQVENDKRVRVIPAKDLLERFLATLRSEMRAAQRENQPVLVLLFGHGISDTFSIPVGGQGSTLDAPRLTRQAFNATVQPGVQISVFMTSCFSGGWLTRPTTGSLLSSMERLNITGMTSVNEEQESRSWSQSVSCGRAAGGRYATAVLNALINTSSYTDGRNSNTVLDEDEGISDNPTFLSLGNSIYEAYKKTDTFYNEHCVSFSAQDDKWDAEWRSRSGFPLTDYEKRWSNLRLVPESGESKAPGGGEASDGDPSLLGFSGSIGRGYHNVVRMKAQAYMESFPGLDDVAGNVDHRQIRQLIDGTKFSEKRLTYINNVLEYRRSAMETANQYVVFLDIKFPDAFEFDAEAWLLQTSPDDPKSASKYARYKKVSEKVSQRKSLFNTPATCQGWFYMKPKRYLAIALTESDLTIEEICDGLDKLVRCKLAASPFYFHSFTYELLPFSKNSSGILSYENAGWSSDHGGRKCQETSRQILRLNRKAWIAFAISIP